MLLPALNPQAVNAMDKWLVLSSEITDSTTYRVVESQPTEAAAIKAAKILNDHNMKNRGILRYCYRPRLAYTG